VERIKQESARFEQETKNRAIQAGRDLISQRIQQAFILDEPSRIPIEYIIYCTHNFSPSLRLGEGGSGQVFEAKDDALASNRFVVKRLNDDEAASFRREKEVNDY